MVAAITQILLTIILLYFRFYATYTFLLFIYKKNPELFQRSAPGWLQLLFCPLRMEAALFVHTLVGVGAEIVPLGLQHDGESRIQVR